MKRSHKIIVVGGVSGVGKTTISKLLAANMELPFFDADDFHPEANVEKMKAGHALDDQDRKPWLAALSRHITKWEVETGAVIACSALKESYRQLLQQGARKPIIWIFLEGSKTLIAERLRQRKDHFFDPKLLQSQFDTYDRPSYGFYVDVSPSPEEIVENIMDMLLGKSPFGIAPVNEASLKLGQKLSRKQLKLSFLGPKSGVKGIKSPTEKAAAYPELAIAQIFEEVPSFLHSLQRPRKIVLTAPERAQKELLKALSPLLEEGDILINVSKKLDLDKISDSKNLTICLEGAYDTWAKKALISTENPPIQEGFQGIIQFFEHGGNGS